jgi:HSP20 family protein
MANRSWLPAWSERNRDAESFRGVRNQIDSFFEDWFGRSMGGVLAPRVDLAEDERAITVTAELPGVQEKDIDISLAGDQLTIRGEKRSEHEDKKEEDGRMLHRVERSYGSFRRVIPLPYRVEPDQVAADFKDGVLTITLPKPPDAVSQKQGQRIEIGGRQGPGQGT